MAGWLKQDSFVIDLRHPLRLHDSNFTPLSRTPWAGKRISELYKPHHRGNAIGESWEFSCDPTFPSLLPDHGCNLQELVEKYPEEILSPKLASTMQDPTCEILIKLLNADDPLSLQVHPEDGDTALTPSECGKPESWLVLDVEKGGGIYIGFSQDVGPDKMRSMLESNQDIKSYLQFVPVKPGDFFDIAPGLVHAIGVGVTLLEPQRIRFGKSGKTYRLWDWGRKYNKDGQIDEKSGHPRELHIDEGLRIIDLANQVGEAFVNSVRRFPEKKQIEGCLWESYPANDYYQVHILSGKAHKRKLSFQDGYVALIPLAGEGTILTGTDTSTNVKAGHPMLLPAVMGSCEISLSVDARCALVLPSMAVLEFS